MFKTLTNLTKGILGIAFSPVSVAADFITMGGLMTDHREPYTATTLRQAMRNMELAFDPDELSDEQITEVLRELERQQRRK